MIRDLEERKMMAAFALEKMFKGDSFSICKIDDACKLMGRSGSGPSYDKLHALHCVKFGEIPANIMQLIPTWINEVLGGPRLSVVQIPALHEGNKSLLSIEDYDIQPKQIK